MSQSTFQGDFYVNGSLSSKTFSAPNGSITNTMVAPNAAINATKLIHQIPLLFNTAVGSAATTQTQMLHIGRAAGEVSSVEVCCNVAPTSSDQITVDVKKGNAASAYTSILDSVVTVDSSNANREVVAGTISTVDYSAGDSFQVVLTVTGSTTQGVCVVVNLHENAQ